MKYAIEILETEKYILLKKIRELEYIGHKERCEVALMPEYLERLEELDRAVEVLGLEAK